MITILDGPMGTELIARGVALDGPAWSAIAIDRAPAVIAAIHRDYAAAGATVHTACTFRTKARQVGDRWEDLTRRAVAIARASVPSSHLVAGSLAPLEDCYRPDLSPRHARPEHRAMAQALARAGVDRILVETFPHAGEAIVAVEEAVATGVVTWLAVTAGPRAELLTPSEARDVLRRARDAGAAALFINCVEAARTSPFVEAIADLGVPFGAYANAGGEGEGDAWRPDGDLARYVAHASRWARAGATIIGGCCGTTPAHIAAIATRFATPII